jgi:glycosyltransferase involved in cell wall biosynthesis
MTRIAWLSPLPPQRSGIADYSAGILPHLAERVKVDAYCEGTPDPVPGVRIVRPTRRSLARLDRYDAVVAHVGNSDVHLWIADALANVPAIVVLHEYVLHHMVAALTIGRGDGGRYLDLMQDEAGRVGRLLGHAVLDGLSAPLWERAGERYPLTGAVLGKATGVICHSHFVAAQIARRFPHMPTTVIPMHAPPISEHPAERPEGATFVVGAFGFVTPNKRLPELMRAVAQLSSRVRGAHLLVVGEAPGGFDPPAMARAAGLGDDQVTCVGYADAARFENLLRGCDVLVNLRHPTLGETSATVVSALANGVPTVVSTGGWYDELPSDAVARIPTDLREVDLLAAVLERLASDPALRQRMTEAGKRYVELRLSPIDCADAYLRAAIAPAALTTLTTAILERIATDTAGFIPPTARSTPNNAERIAMHLRDLGLLRGASRPSASRK